LNFLRTVEIYTASERSPPGRGVQKCEHQFEKDNEPYSCTMMFLLSESHLSIHTLVDEGKISLDLFTCGLGTDFDKLRYIRRDYFDVNILCINSYYFTRGD
jgi:S-adenosylmethionine/arginine decarboxylase-like enzyme